MVDENNENLIEVVPVKATAGYLAGYDDPEYIEQLQKIKLPFLPTGKHRAFPIKGGFHASDERRLICCWSVYRRQK